MKKKPLSIRIISLFYFLAPLVNVAQTAYFNHWPLFGPRSVFYHFSGTEWMIMGFFPLVAFGVFNVTRSGYFLFLGFSAFLILRNSYLYMLNPAYNIYLVLLFHLITAGSVGFFLQKHIIAPYFNPKLKWWKRDERFPINIAAQARFHDQLLDCSVLDVSLSGCFAKVAKPFKLGDMVWIYLSVGDAKFSAMAKVMWVNTKSPKGFGFMFVGMEPSDKKNIKKLISYLKKSGSKVSVPSAA